jgi:hypothetical protein
MKLGVLVFAAAPALIACGGGAETRTPDQWQQEVGAEVAAKTADLRACYRAAGGSAKQSIALTITATPSSDATATLSTSKASATTDPNSSGPVADCVANALKGLPLPTPSDSNIGDGTWHVTFDPTQLDPTAPVPPAAPGPAAAASPASAAPHT